MEENSLIIFTQASKMLAEADTIQKAKELKDLGQEIAGVYIFFFKNKCIYIGESSNIKKRLASHDYREWLNIPGTQLFWFKCNNRRKAEKELINKYQPLLNNKGSYVNVIAINEARGYPIKEIRRYFEIESLKVKNERQKAMKEYLGNMAKEIV